MRSNSFIDLDNEMKLGTTLYIIDNDKHLTYFLVKSLGIALAAITNFVKCLFKVKYHANNCNL